MTRVLVITDLNLGVGLALRNAGLEIDLLEHKTYQLKCVERYGPIVPFEKERTYLPPHKKLRPQNKRRGNK